MKQNLSSIFMDLLNTKPIGFMDIGARGGIHPLVEQFSEAVHVVGFEPDHEAFTELQRDLAESSDYARADIEQLVYSMLREIIHYLSCLHLPTHPFCNLIKRSRKDTQWRNGKKLALHKLEQKRLTKSFLRISLHSTIWVKQSKLTPKELSSRFC